MVATGSRGSAGTAGRGWLAGLADVGRSLRLGWYEGCTVLTAVTLTGVVTGWGVAPASTNERPLAETLIAGRQQPDPSLPTGAPRSLPIWPTAASPAGPTRRTWPPPTGSPWWPRWAATARSWRQCRAACLTPSGWRASGFQARLAAKVALRNRCCWLNQHRGRPLLAVADLVDW